jgi:hypothetical protein
MDKNIYLKIVQIIDIYIYIYIYLLMACLGVRLNSLKVRLTFKKYKLIEGVFKSPKSLKIAKIHTFSKSLKMKVLPKNSF